MVKTVTASEKDVLRVVADLKKANRTDISRQLGYSTDYTFFLCKSLRGLYLREVGIGLYELTPSGEEVVAKMRKVKKEVRKEDVLKLVRDLKHANPITISGKLKISLDEAGSFCDSLEDQGLLEAVGKKLYKLTSKGEKKVA